jgi:hypothetical protein
MSDTGDQRPIQGSTAPGEHRVGSDDEALRSTLMDLWDRLPVLTLRFALGVNALFVVLYLIGVAFFAKAPNAFFLLSLEREGNPPSWWYGSQQLLVALVFLALASRMFEFDERIRPLRALFFASALGFTFISLDEVGELHELGSRMLLGIKGIQALETTFEHSVLHVKHHLHGGGLWIVVYAIVGVVVLAWLIPRVVEAYKIWPREVITVGVGFGIFAFSAAVLQVLGYFTKSGTSIHVLYVVVEQALKMSGISIALFGALSVLSAGAQRLVQQLGGRDAHSPEPELS